MSKKIFALQLVFIFLIIFNAFSLNAKVLMQPYLQAPTENSITLMVETDSKDDVVVNYQDNMKSVVMTGKTSFYIKVKEKKKVFVHRVLLNKLEPGIEYNYTLNDEYNQYKG
ncbi:MAG: fibronectin type III domain-containing protein, partial [Ignavibacteriae bacterium]|nr:fibronectin type III domain-containing protein [Ignavibacteriota bacterium]